MHNILPESFGPSVSFTWSDSFSMAFVTHPTRQVATLGRSCMLAVPPAHNYYAVTARRAGRIPAVDLRLIIEVPLPAPLKWFCV